ncbi:UPF0488 protein C8orf33 homolog isoform X2 [Dunckerocampus dactyliophorus]|uniref:UPF0488 protein C8orf33 homolog isoform X2 n=1 Tax=Dunckerocampus dactyliophorus TaxID=161453 RepID=UPI002406F7C3|nr:UPF0488 protein C8orf33 homolog isoform X2 [Dunckerocampus dactyliophorus]
MPYKEAAKPHWTHSNNNFRFIFFPEDLQTQQEASSVWPLPNIGQKFTFNFQIPPDAPIDNMAAEMSDPQNENCTTVPGASSLLEQPPQSKAKNTKKCGKKKLMASSEAPRQTSATEGSQEGKNTELSAEEQFKRQLDWCIEQLELGMKSHKATPKQREDASHGLKTLRSSKAPLVKKRQVMRAMAGDYRKKMEEEKNKQFKLIRSAQVKVKSGSLKKSVFHRRAEGKQEENQHQSEAQESNLKTPQEGFVFTASKEEFRFNFL